MTREIITRFAPSPTGFLHIGGARTALFNWLFAKANGGQMKLRIEDTDRARYQPQAVSAILEGLSWLGLNWDGAPVSQFERRERHVEIALQLLAASKAYYCYATPEELAQMREKAKRQGRSPRYDGRWRARDASEAPKGIAPAIRIKAEQTGKTLIQDRVQGAVQFSNEELDDFVILRSDGTPTYMLAVVVDDYDMGVTHIIRGDDHLTNAARQFQIYKALGWLVPEIAHIPLIHGPDGAKLSKRHGALGVEAYQKLGYLPDALRNYLVRLGWSHGNEEVISRQDMINWFGLDGIGKSPARFDFAKLESLNAAYMRETEDKHLITCIENLLLKLEPPSLFGKKLKSAHKSALLRLMPGLKQRTKTLIQVIEMAEFIAAETPLQFSEKAASVFDEAAHDTLLKLLEQFKNCAWETSALEKELKDFAERQELKFAKIAQPLRAALTGGHSSPSIYEVLMALGHEESMKRIQNALERF